MKKVFLFALSLVLVGAGCTSLGGNKVVEGDWSIAFDLPNDWVMVQPYQPSDTPINLDGEITPTDAEVYLQSTDLHILPEGSGQIEEDRVELFGEIVESDFTRISVLKLDPRRVIPSESEDLGDGFFKDGEIYYFETEDAKYKFTILSEGQSTDEAVEVIVSAQVVGE